MAPQTRSLLLMVALLGPIAGGCRREASPVPAGPARSTTATTPPAPDPTAAALAAFNRGTALLEQYRYAEAAAALEPVVAALPSWTAARVNLGLALLNQQDTAGGAEAVRRAEVELARVLEADPTNRWAHFALGVAAQTGGLADEAIAHYEAVRKSDPDDLYLAYKYAEVLEKSGRLEDAVRVLEEITARDAGFVSGFFRLGNLYNRTKRRDKAVVVFRRFKELNAQELAVGSYGVRDPYSAMGRYYTALDATGLPVPPEARTPAPRVVFAPEVRDAGPPLRAWAYPGGTIRLPGLGVGDTDKDGDLDLVVSGAGANGEAVVLVNDGKGAFGAPIPLADGVVAPVLGDLDNDGDPDLWLGRAGADQCLLNDGKGTFRPATLDLAPAGALTACARLVDLDGDGDLDAIGARRSGGDVPAGADGVKPAASYLLNNNLDGTFADRAGPLGLDLADTPVAAWLADDLDDDRDIDLLILPADGPPIAWENHRVGRYRLRDNAATGIDLAHPASATTGDPFRSGRRDVLVSAGDRLALYRNRGGWRFEPDAEFAARFGALGGTGGQFVDIDNDSDQDLFLPDARRRDGTRGPVLLLNDAPRPRFVDASEADPGNLLASLKTDGPASGVAADLDGDGRPELVLAAPGAPLRIVPNVTKGGHWIALDLAGRRPADATSRAPDSPVGARVELRAGAAVQQWVVGVPAGATAMPPLRVHAGLGEHPVVSWLRVLWPDSILQAELEVPADRVRPLSQVSRRTSSCPHLFAWDGTRFAFVSDFGGVGGLGYLVAPGRYAPPDPTEVVRLPDIQPRDGDYVFQVVEPLEEAVYLDQVSLVAVDHPAGTEVYPHELAAVNAPPPPAEVFCFREQIPPARATDGDGRDVTDALRRTDRVTAGATRPDRRFLGYAAGHEVVLDFGDRLGAIPATARPVLLLDGWVEYSTSTSNYAASQAGLRLEAPSLAVERDGAWIDLAREAGYPAGMNHVMTLDLAGKLRPGDRRLRVVSNMDLHWDRIALALHDAKAGVIQKEVPVRAADLHFLGYPREFSPDGRRPNLLDYANVDTSDTWHVLAGAYTRYGDVPELLGAADDRFVLMAPGDEVTLRVPAATFGPVPPGCTRTFHLRTHSYCKDADPYTGAGGRLDPMPYRGMPAYPYPPGAAPPASESDRSYNTRVLRP
jgi:hypothetical protein